MYMPTGTEKWIKVIIIIAIGGRRLGAFGTGAEVIKTSYVLGMLLSKLFLKQVDVLPSKNHEGTV